MVAMSFLAMQRPILAAATAAACLSRPRLAVAAAAPFGAQLTNVLAQGRRQASVKAQGAYRKKSKRGIPNKLGAKRTGGKHLTLLCRDGSTQPRMGWSMAIGCRASRKLTIIDQFVIPGNILYKQRGTHWWPGENCIMGRDHTIHSMATGYVKYYRDPSKHPDRKYIGVVFDKADSLPYPQHAERRRRLNMTAFPIRPAAETPALSPSGIPFEVKRVEQGEPDRLLRLRSDYSYREDNWRIGRLVNTTGLRTKRFRTRKQWFRHRRWRRERELEGQRKAEEKRAESGGDGKIVMAVSKKAAKKAAKKAGKKGK